MLQGSFILWYRWKTVFIKLPCNKILINGVVKCNNNRAADNSQNEDVSLKCVY